MDSDTMGKVLVAATIENLSDVLLARAGHLDPYRMRRVDVMGALVDTGATSLCMPQRLVDQLGLVLLRVRNARTSAGLIDAQVYETVRLTVQGRDCPLAVTAIADDCPVLIGQIALEAMDFVVDPGRHRLIGNPDHGGEQMIEIY